MRASFLLPILLFGSIIGCSKKDNDDDVPTAKIDTVIITSIADIICDDTAGTNWTNYNVMIEGTQNWIPVYFNIDADNNQVPEFRLISKIYGSPGGGGYFGYSMIESLDSSTMFSGYIESDTTFYHKTSGFFPQTPPLVIFGVQEYYSCYDLTGADSLLIKNNFRVTPLNAGDTVTANFIYQAGYITLIDRNRTFGGSTGIIFGPDTAESCLIHNNANECHNFPMNAIEFIGFKTKINNVTKYGWIKLSITNNNKIFIYSTAIQK